MKLEIKHILLYLPDLKIKWDDTSEVMGVTFNYETDYDKMLYPLSTLEHVINKTNDGDYGFKPILRPLSDLPKEIEIDGNKFYPLYVLNTMRGVTTELDNYKFFMGEGIYPTCEWGDGGYGFWFDPDTNSFLDMGCHGMSPQLDMFQKLFEWHVDVFGLIPEGLAIDINTIKQ